MPKNKMEDYISDYENKKSEKERLIMVLELGLEFVESRRLEFIIKAKKRAIENGDVDTKWKNYLWDQEVKEMARMAIYVDDYLKPTIKKIQDDEVKVL